MPESVAARKGRGRGREKVQDGGLWPFRMALAWAILSDSITCGWPEGTGIVLRWSCIGGRFHAFSVERECPFLFRAATTSLDGDVLTFVARPLDLQKAWLDQAGFDLLFLHRRVNPNAENVGCLSPRPLDKLAQAA
jgi:hypothetical protein